MCAPSSRLSATRMPAMRYRLALETCEMRHALTVCRTNCLSNSEYSSPLRARMSITLGKARRVASSTVNPLIPRLYTWGSSRSSSRRLGTLNQSYLMFFVSVMVSLYLTEASETIGKCLQSKHFRTLRPFRPRFQLVVWEWGGKLGNPPPLRTGTLCAEG